MIITHVDQTPSSQFAYLNIFPNQFRTDKEKEDPSWIKETMDYFANVAYSQYLKNKKTFAKNYDLMNGIIDYADFYQEQPEVKGFVETLLRDTELPKYVKHYPILNPPVNTMVGELSKRPDIHKVRAFDDDSKNEELQAKTEIVQQLILQMAKEQLVGQMAMQGQDPSQLEDGEFEKLALDKVNEYMTSYTSLGESWGNHMLTALKIDLNTKEQSEEAFRDLLICARERFLIYEDNSKRGFNSKVVNTRNYWDLGTPDMKYTSGASGHQNVPYANGTVEVMEISQIIEEVPELTLEEIEHLKKSSQDYGLLNVRESNLTSGKTGPDSIIYDTYNRLILQERMIVEGEMKENRDELKDWLGLSNNIGVFGQKYTVVRSFWNSKKKIGLLKYLDEDNEPQSMLVDENYKKSPNQIGQVEWGWINQMYQGIRIGPNVFHVKPFKLLPYSPLIGMTYGLKNSQAKSLVDLMKPFQVLYNISFNQLFELYNKEIGNVASISLRRIPRLKEGDAQDEIDMFEADAKKRGILYDDDSPENTKGGVSNQTVARNVDLTRSNEMQTRYNLAVGFKAECWELIGMNRQRLGAATATETATANQNNLVQSFAQTEPYFAAHEYVMNQYYQALLDAAQYVEGTKENSTISYITNQGENAFLQVTGAEIKLKDLKIFVTSRAEDQQLLNEFRQLSQAMIQNGASVYDMSVLYTTNSIRQMQKVFKDLRDKNEALKQQEQQLEQQKLQQQQEQVQATLTQQEDHFQQEQAMEKYKTDVKANTDLAKAEISTFFQAPTTDGNNNGIPDIMEIANHSQKVTESLAKRDLENKKLSLDLIRFQAEQKNKKVEHELAKEKLANEKARTKVMVKNKTKK